MTMLLGSESIVRRKVSGTMSLVPGSARGIAVHGGAVIRVLSGVVWLTEEGDGGDYVLRAGEHFIAPRSGRIVVEAIQGRASVSLL